MCTLVYIRNTGWVSAIDCRHIKMKACSKFLTVHGFMGHKQDAAKFCYIVSFIYLFIDVEQPTNINKLESTKCVTRSERY